MILKWVTLSTNFDDYLAITLPHNKRFFDDIVVVTTPNDLKTQEVCRRHNTRFVATERFHEDGAPFNRGKGINEGIKALNLQVGEWLTILDADMVLPSNFDQFRNEKLDPDFMYAGHRRFCPSIDEYHEAVRTNTEAKFPFGMFHQHPIGCFQIVCHTGTRDIFYPEFSPTSDKSDVHYSFRWQPNWRWTRYSPLHLGPTKIYWSGRTSEQREANQ